MLVLGCIMAEILITGPIAHGNEGQTPQIGTEFNIMDDGKILFTSLLYEEAGKETFYFAMWPAKIPLETFWSNVETFTQELEAGSDVKTEYRVYPSSGERIAKRPLPVEEMMDPTIYGPNFMRIYGEPVGFYYDATSMVSKEPYFSLVTSSNNPDQLCRFIQGNSDGSIPDDLLREVLTDVGRRSQVRLTELANAPTKTQA